MQQKDESSKFSFMTHIMRYFAEQHILYDWLSNMYLHGVWQSSVQHGEDGQIGAQVRNHSTGGTLQRDR